MKFTERDKARFWIKVKQTKMCWEWTGTLNKHGYGVFNHKKETLAHRISYQIIFGDVFQDQILHKCDNPKCVNPDHLFLGTHQDNMTDRNNKGRTNRPKGEKNASAKLSEQQVKEIKNDPRASRRLGEIYGVSKTQILRIKNNVFI